MASSRSSTAKLALFLTLNILLFVAVNACGTSCPTPTPKPKPKPKPTPKPTPIPCPTPPAGAGSPAQCPRDTLKLGVCADVLNLVNIVVGSRSPAVKCCALLEGLVDTEAAVCLCTALKANVLGINLNIPVSLELLLNVCSKQAPEGFQCA